MGERLLIKRVRQGDLSAWRQLIKHHQDVVFQMAYLARADYAGAQDIAQHTFLQGFNLLHAVEDRQSLQAWLLQLCWRNVSTYGTGFARLRRSLKYALHLIGVKRDAPQQSTAVIELWSAVKQLPLDDQQLAYLRLFLGANLAETAQATNMQLNEIRQRLSMISESLVENAAAIASSFKFPQAPMIDEYVIDEIEGNSPYQFKSQPLRWTGAALFSISLVLASVVLLSNGESSEDQVASMPTAGLGRSSSAGQYSSASAGRGFEAEPMANLSLAGETTLEAARQTFPFQVLLPPDMPPPDRIYLQNTPAAGLILLWLDESGQQELALFQLAPNARYSKLEASIVGRPIVHGEPALWIEGTYSVLLEDGKLVRSRMEGGRLLVWSQGDLGLRLETKGSLSAALELAESLQ